MACYCIYMTSAITLNRSKHESSTFLRPWRHPPLKTSQNRVVAPGTVGVQVAWCGICGTDLHEFMEGPIFIPPCGHPHPISGESAPITMGHEFSGVVYTVSEGVTTLQVGQHVVVEPYIVADDVPTGVGDHYHLSKDA